MKQKNSDWDKLVNMANNCNETNKDLAKNATQIINVKFNAVKQKRLVSPTVIGGICLVFLMVISMLIYLLIPKQPELRYYNYSDLNKVSIESVNEFLVENNLDICVFNDATVKSEAVVIKENNSIAYLNQTGFLFGDSSMDTINLYIKLVNNSKFDFEDDFGAFTNTKLINNTSVKYVFNSNADEYEFISKFEYKQVDYYLSIKTSESDVDVIMQHIEILIKD